MKNILAIVCLFGLTIITSCTDGSIIGNDLLGDEEIALQFDENFELSGQTVLGDSVPTYSLGSNNQTYLLGDIDDPIFGRYSSDIYFAFRNNANFSDFEGAVLDSVVLDLEYDESGFYGDTTAVHDIEVYRVTEDLIERDTIYSDQSFMTDMTPLASVSLVPSLSKELNVKLRDLEVDSTITLSPRLRIRLDDAFGNEIIETQASSPLDSTLSANFKGLYITSNSNGKSMIGLNFNELTEFNNGIARLHVYYSKTDTSGVKTLGEYSYLMSSVTSSNFIHDYTGSIVGNALNDPQVGDNALYVQSMAGVNAEVEFPNLNILDNFNEDTVIINAAQLVLTVNEEDSEVFTDLYSPDTRFILSKESEDGNGRLFIDDLTKDGIELAQGLDILDGRVREVVDEQGRMIKTVTFGITDYVRNLIRNDISSGKVIISPIGRSESPGRTVFYGLNHPDFPAKLRIAYTRI